jgi:hypothetical protein
MKTLVFDPVVPIRWLGAAWLLLGLATLAYAVGRGYGQNAGRRILLALGHAVVPAFLLVLLHGPSWVEVKPQAGKKPPFVVLIDGSASMAAEGGSGTKGTRFEQALDVLKTHEEEWNGLFQVRTFTFDREVHPELPKPGAPPEGAMTDLAAAIDGGLLSGSPPAGALLLSDGIHNATESDPLQAARRARAVGCPIFTMTLGSDAAVKDLGLDLAQSEGLTFVRQPYRVLATLTHRGYENIEATVRVRLAGKVVQERRVPVTGTADIRIELDLVQDKPGLYEYEVGVDERPDEVFKSNNRRRLALRVVDERIRVLILEGKPYWDSKFLIQALRHDANVALSSIIRVTESRCLWDGPSTALAPKDLERPLEDRGFLDICQVVILGRDVESFLTPAAIANLRDWISARGGHLIVSRGRPVGLHAAQENLLGILPVQWTEDEERRFRLELTERGRVMTLFRASPRGAAAPKVEDDPRVVLKELPSLVSATRVEKERAMAVVLARGQGAGPVSEMAVLTFQQYGAGKVLVLEGQGLWRWAFQPPETPGVSHAVFEGFWSNVIRWLAGSNDFLPSQSLTLRVAKPVFMLDERPLFYVLERAAAAGQGAPPEPTLEILREDGPPNDRVAFPLRVQAPPVPGDPTLRRATLDPLPEGRYRVRLRAGADATAPPTAESIFEVTPPLQERLDLRSRPELMRKIAQASDGEAIPPGEADRVVDAYLRYTSRFRPDLEIRTPAWDEPLLWMAFVGWLALLWYGRRRWGMI